MTHCSVGPSGCGWCLEQLESNAHEETRALLTAALAQAAMHEGLRAERDALNKACAEEMLKREAMQKNWDRMTACVKEKYEEAEAARVEVREARQQRDTRADEVAQLRFRLVAVHAELAALKAERPTDAQQRALNAATYTTAMNHVRERQERDEARASLQTMTGMFDETLDKVERLKVAFKLEKRAHGRTRLLKAKAQDALQSVAEKQRVAVRDFLDDNYYGCAQSEALFDNPLEVVMATPLVTDTKEKP